MAWEVRVFNMVNLNNENYIKKIKSEDGYYVTYDGKVWSEKRKKWLKPTINSHGYYKVCLNNKQFKVHRLVAEAFIPNPYNYPQINHKDEVKTNNNAKNLEWCTLQYNVSYGKRLFMLKKWKAIWKCDRYTHEKIEKFHCICAAAQKLGNLQWSKHIGDVLKGRRKSAYGFWWCYAKEVGD